MGPPQRPRPLQARDRPGFQVAINLLISCLFSAGIALQLIAMASYALALGRLNLEATIYACLIGGIGGFISGLIALATNLTPDSSEGQVMTEVVSIEEDQ